MFAPQSNKLARPAPPRPAEAVIAARYGLTMPCRASVVWDDAYLGYDFGDHPMHPVRLDLTIRLARALGVLDEVDVRAPEPADEATLLTAHSPDYLAALRAASTDPDFVGHGLGTPDNPVFPGMYDAGALIAGGSVLAAAQVWRGRSDHAVNIAGGLHHAMYDSASGFCLLNDVVIAIRWLLDNGARRVAYVDVDVHHGDGVQAAFWDDPRVLTVSLHQHPATLFPGTGLPSEVGAGAARGDGGERGLAAGHGRRGLAARVRSGRARCGAGVRAGRPGEPVRLRHPPRRPVGRVGAQRGWPGGGAAVDAHAGPRERGRALGGVRRRWLRGAALRAADVDQPHRRGGRRPDRPVDPDTAGVDERLAGAGDHGRTADRRWARERCRYAPVTSTGRRRGRPVRRDWLDRSIAATRNAVYPLLGLDPDDPRD